MVQVAPHEYSPFWIIVSFSISDRFAVRLGLKNNVKHKGKTQILKLGSKPTKKG